MSLGSLALRLLELASAASPGILAAVGRTQTDEEALERARAALLPLIDTSEADAEQDARIRGDG